MTRYISSALRRASSASTRALTSRDTLMTFLGSPVAGSNTVRIVVSSQT